MSESIWWRDEYWWEQKSIPLGPVTLSLRQLATLAAFAFLGLLVSIPVSFPVIGIAFGGKAVTFFACFVVGWVVSKKRVKMVPVELQMVYALRNREGGQKKKAGSKEGGPATVGMKKEEKETEMVVEDFKSVTALSVVGRVPVRKQSKLLFLVDGKERANPVVVSPQVPEYRFVFSPNAGDIGTHNAEIIVEGEKEPASRLKLVIRKQGVEMLEAKES